MLCLSGFELHSRWVPLSHAVCLADLRNQLLCPKTLVMFPFSWDFWSHARQRNRSSFTYVHFWTCKYMGCKTDVCRFCSLITQISFFSLNVYSIAWIPVWGDLRLRVDSFSKHRLVIESRGKTVWKKVQRKSKTIFLLKAK